MVNSYKKACSSGTLQPGRMQIYVRDVNSNPRYIINFPTKRHWKDRSRLEDIQAGLAALVKEVGRLGIGSIAIPPLGCGLGGLSWEEVYPLIKRAFEQIAHLKTSIYLPGQNKFNETTIPEV
jgi:O-acetyl-ADP-ribose deacetylase (regulator of RNase III)